MPRKRPPSSTFLFIVAATAVGLALAQMTRHRLQADDFSGSGARNAAGARKACASAPPHGAPPGGTSSARDSAAVVLRLDYSGAEALMSALERDSLSEADVDSLLRIRGLCAMVDNVARFIPGIGVTEFRREIRKFARTRKGGEYDRYFQLSGVWRERSRIRALLAAIRKNERAIVEGTISQLERFRPDTGTLVVTAYFVAGGVSDGFAFENDRRSFYANLARADGDMNGVVLNMAHEAYHVMQFTAQERAGIADLSVAADTTALVERLLATTLSEGTANYVVDPTRVTATGPAMERSRERYRRSAEPRRITGNFALFDTVLAGLRKKRMTWDEAYLQGFTSANDEAFYFVGYEMTRALERYCGRECIRRLFDEPPVEFFRRYVALYHRHPEITGRFSRETEAFITAYGADQTR